MRKLFIFSTLIILAAIAVGAYFWTPFIHLYFIAVPLALVGVFDMIQTKHSVLRIYPLFGHFRFLAERMRPEIQQYFINTDQSGRPFNREMRSMVYQRAKNVIDTIPFGTQHDLDEPGATWVKHSLKPTKLHEHGIRVTVGGKQCKKPYSASRLNISAMSYGALSPTAVMALNNGARIGGFAHNTGEGGLTEYHKQGGDIIWQIGTGYFGCRTKAGGFCEKQFQEKSTIDEVKMIEIKLSQGAKPSHGGILPAAKVDAEIARLRGVPIGEDCISPPAHQTFHSPRGLLEYVVQLRELCGGKPVGFKLCIGHQSEFLGICKAMLETGIYPDFITVDGAEGGTGAAPVEFSDSMGTPLNEALSFVHNALVGTNLRDKLYLIASGKVISGMDLISKFAMGADLCNSARGMLFSLGCIQSLKCNTNMCPTGVTTNNPERYQGLHVETKAQRVANFHKNTLKSMMEIAGAMGLNHLSDIKAYDVHVRSNTREVSSLNQLYPAIEPGVLLSDDIPAHFKNHWDAADPDKF